MENPLPIINNLMVDVFNDILSIEAATIKSSFFGDISMAEIHTLEAVGLNRRQTMGEIAKCLHITVGTLTVAVNKLVKKGYLERFRVEDDRRVVQIDLTKKGRAVFRAHQAFHANMVAEATSGLSGLEIEVLYSALQKIHVFLTRQYIAPEGEVTSCLQ